MAYAPNNENPDGGFEHKETNVVFEYLNGPEYIWDAEQGATHSIFVRDGEIRGAKILKTVAHVIVDEDENGNAVWEKWPIKHLWAK
jgi:hypothetical protein